MLAISLLAVSHSTVFPLIIVKPSPITLQAIVKASHPFAEAFVCLSMHLTRSSSCHWCLCAESRCAERLYGKLRQKLQQHHMLQVMTVLRAHPLPSTLAVSRCETKLLSRPLQHSCRPVLYVPINHYGTRRICPALEIIDVSKKALN